MKLLLIFPVFFFFVSIQVVGVGARTYPDRLSTVDAATSESTASPSWPSGGSNMIKDRLSFDENIWRNTVLQFGNNTTQIAASLGAHIAERGTDYVKQGLQTVTPPLGTSGTDRGAGQTNQVLGLVQTQAGLDFLSESGKTAMNIASNLGTNAENAVNILEDTTLSFNNLSLIETNVLSNIVNITNSIEQGMISTGTNAMKSIIDTGFDVLHQMIDANKSTASEETNHISSSLNMDSKGSISTRNILRVPPR
uniref:Hemolysin-like secreted salivary protein n=1 Tax=Triatoma matogrossensis TaxID=162370 RepID=E2J783_9HEMI